MSPILSRLTFALLAAGLAFGPLPLSAANSTVQPSAGQQEESWTINLKGADIREFIDQVAQITGQTFVVDPRVKGQVSVVSSSPLNLSEVYQLFLSVMATHGFSVLTHGDQARIVPNAEAKAEAGLGRVAPDRLETRLIQVQHGSATELIPLLRPLVPQYGHLAAVTSANAIIISDRSANIARIEDLLRQLDQKGERDYSVLNLQHAWVMDAAEVLNSALERGQAKGASGTQVIADARTNRLILLGPPAARAKLVALAQSLDTPTSRSANTRVIRLRHNDAKALAETLGDISEGLKNQEGGETTVGTVATRLGIDPSRASRLTTELIRKGLVRRGVSQEDARRAILEATTEGDRIVQAVRAFKFYTLGSFLKSWTKEEVSTFLPLLERFSTWSDAPDDPTGRIAAE